jgi:hypothetical protein
MAYERVAMVAAWPGNRWVVPSSQVGGGTDWLTSDKTTPKIDTLEIILFGIHESGNDRISA